MERIPKRLFTRIRLEPMRASTPGIKKTVTVPPPRHSAQRILGSHRATHCPAAGLALQPTSTAREWPTELALVSPKYPHADSVDCRGASHVVSRQNFFSQGGSGADHPKGGFQQARWNCNSQRHK